MSYARVPPELLAQRHLPPNLFNISVGVEDVEDLITDLEQAIYNAKPQSLVAAESAILT